MPFPVGGGGLSSLGARFAKRNCFCFSLHRKSSGIFSHVVVAKRSPPPFELATSFAISWVFVLTIYSVYRQNEGVFLCDFHFSRLIGSRWV